MSTELFNLGAQGLLSFPAKAGLLVDTDIFTISSVQDQKSYNVSWSSLKSNMLTRTNTKPSSESASGTYGTCYVDNDVVYIYTFNGWKGIKLFQTFEEAKRDYLPISDGASITVSERNNALDLLDIFVYNADRDRPGLVAFDKEVFVYNPVQYVWTILPGTSSRLGLLKIANDTGNTKTVPSYSWVVEQIAEAKNYYKLPVATTGSLGGIKQSQSIIVDPQSGTATVPDASENTKGIVKIVNNVFDPVNNPTATVGSALLNTLLEAIKSIATTPPIATSLSIGGIRVGNTLTINSNTGILNVPVATGTSAGIVPSILTAVNEAPTATSPVASYGISQYVVQKIETLALTKTATVTRLGGIKASSSINISDDGVASVPIASDSTMGIIFLENAGGEDPAPSKTLSKHVISNKISEAVDAITPFYLGRTYVMANTTIAQRNLVNSADSFVKLILSLVTAHPYTAVSQNFPITITALFGDFPNWNILTTGNKISFDGWYSEGEFRGTYFNLNTNTYGTIGKVKSSGLYEMQELLYNLPQ